MTQELLYTSAPQGLKPQSRGFCTVVSSYGMAQNLADRLEALSGYRQVFPPGDPRVALNPVVYSHVSFSVGGKKLHVLSRIAACGVDYTQRANKLAHHVALGREELSPAGPAATLAKAGFMQQDWDGQTRILPAGRQLPQTDQPPVRCEVWQRLAGDAGWAGVLAETAIAEPRKSAVLLFEPGQELLPLFVEALALLPASLRWTVSFSTYYTKLPPGIDCQWRGLLAGSAEAKAAVRAPNILVLDLTRPMGPPPECPFVEAARSGQWVTLPPTDSVPVAAAPVVTSRPTPSPRAATLPRSPANEIDWESAPISNLGSGTVRPRPPRSLSRLWLILSVLAVGLLLGAVGGAAAFWLLGPEAPQVPRVAVAETAKPKQTDKAAEAVPSEPTPSAASADEPSDQTEGQAVAPSGANPPTSNDQQSASSPGNEVPSPLQSNTPQPSPNSAPGQAAPVAFDLPKRPKTTFPNGGTQTPAEYLLASSAQGIDTIDIVQPILELKGKRFACSSTEDSHWKIQLNTDTKVFSDDIATLTADGDKLRFAWNLKTSEVADQLRNCGLLISFKDGSQQFIALRTPRMGNAIPLVEPGMSARTSPNSESLIPLSEWASPEGSAYWPNSAGSVRVQCELSPPNTQGLEEQSLQTKQEGQPEELLRLRRAGDPRSMRDYLKVEWDGTYLRIVYDDKRLDDVIANLSSCKDDLNEMSGDLQGLKNGLTRLSGYAVRERQKQIEELEKKIEPVDARRKLLDAERTDLEPIRSARLYLRVYLEFGGHKVIVAETSDRSPLP